MSRGINEAEWLQRAARYHQTGAPLEAEQLYKKVLRSKPNHPEAKFNLALLHAEHGRIRSAKSILDDLLRARPDDGGAHCLIAKLLERDGEVRKASYHFARAVRLLPGRLEVHLDLIRTYGLLHRIDDARLAAEHALKQFSDSQEIRLQLGVALAGGGRNSTRNPEPV